MDEVSVRVHSLAGVAMLLVFLFDFDFIFILMPRENDGGRYTIHKTNPDFAQELSSLSSFPVEICF